MPPVHDLPERLELPLASGEAWWYWLGGRPALDLVNTLRERWRRRVETLVTPGDLGVWLARALREAIDVCVAAFVAGDPAPAGAVRAIDGLLVHAGTRPHLALDAGGRP